MAIRQRLSFRSWPRLRALVDDPPVLLIPEYVAVDEAVRLVRASAPRLRPSGVQHTTEEERYTDSRTSESVFLHHRSAPTLMERAETLVGLPRTHFEWPSVTRYRVGDRFGTHIDAFNLETESGRRAAGRGGQRVATLLIYLSECAGGVTRFPLLGVDVTPRTGSALLFFPGFTDGNIDHALQHSAEPPTCGEKWVAQIWVRQHVLHDAATVGQAQEASLPPRKCRTLVDPFSK